MARKNNLAARRRHHAAMLAEERRRTETAQKRRASLHARKAKRLADEQLSLALDKLSTGDARDASAEPASARTTPPKLGAPLPTPQRDEIMRVSKAGPGRIRKTKKALVRSRKIRARMQNRRVMQTD